MLKKNDIYTLEIDSMSNKGYGVCRIDGMVVFVHGAVAGDTARIKIIKTAKNYAVAHAEEIVSASQNRKTPDCGIRACGGCVFQDVTEEYELLEKENYVRAAMMKEGLSLSVASTATDGRFTAYRNKAQFPVTLDKEGRMRAGFYAEKTHRVVPCEICAINPVEFSKIAEFICRFCDKHGIKPYDEASGKGLLRHIYLRSGKSGILTVLVLNGRKLPHGEELAKELTAEFPDIVGLLINVNTENTNIILGDEYITVSGVPYIYDTLLGKEFKISPQSFYQVNRTCCELLYSKAAELLDAQKGDTVIDLYCGIGTVGLCVTGDECDLIGIEIVPEAIRDASENAKRQRRESARFYAADASEILKYTDGKIPDSVIVDPPRKGLSEELIKTLAELNVGKIVYISCDPATLARDLKLFLSLGYTASTVYPFNMFPRTAHVENVVCLTR